MAMTAVSVCGGMNDAHLRYERREERMITTQVAAVVRASEEDALIVLGQLCSSLEEASKWAEDHEDQLNKGERYDIYYRYEIIEEK